MTQQVDSQAVKDQQKEQWGSAASGWRKNHETLRQRTAGVTERMLVLAGVEPGYRVLDIACGSGEPAIPAARAVGSTGFVLATDMSIEMLEVAREKAAEQGVTNIEFRLVDGEELEIEANSFDAVTCRWGLMFMPEPVRCLRQAHRALKPGGRICAAVWGPMERNPFFTVPMTVLRQHLTIPPPDPSAPGIFALADQHKLDFMFTQAGFRATQIEGLEVPMAAFDSGEEFWQYTREMAAPVAALAAQVPTASQELVAQQIAEKASEGNPDGKVTLSGYSLLASAVK